MPIGEWVREVAFEAARGRGARDRAVEPAADLAKLARVNLEEMAALRAILLTLFGSTHPSLTQEQVEKIQVYADSVKRDRVEALLKRLL